MDIPESMRAELGAWNGGAGIDLQGWISCLGNFEQAIGYAALFWPAFKLVDGHLVRPEITVEQVRGCASHNAARSSVEAVLNHLHLAYFFSSSDGRTTDKLLALGKVLKEMYEARLARQFPDRPCTVSLYIPEDADALEDYEITFWQNASESVPARPETTP